MKAFVLDRYANPPALRDVWPEPSHVGHMRGTVPALAPVPVRAVEVEAETGGALGDDLRRREFQMIIDTLRTERGRRKEAAERLGISPRTLRYKLAQMRDAGMDVEAYLFAT